MLMPFNLRPAFWGQLAITCHYLPILGGLGTLPSKGQVMVK